jgi:hypothetical protein
LPDCKVEGDIGIGDIKITRQANRIGKGGVEEISAISYAY